MKTKVEPKRLPDYVAKAVFDLAFAEMAASYTPKISEANAGKGGLFSKLGINMRQYIDLDGPYWDHIREIFNSARVLARDQYAPKPNEQEFLDKFLDSTGNVTWLLNDEFFIETDHGNYIWSNPEFHGTNLVRMHDGAIAEYLKQIGKRIVRSKGKQPVKNFCNSRVRRAS